MWPQQSQRLSRVDLRVTAVKPDCGKLQGSGHADCLSYKHAVKHSFHA